MNDISNQKILTISIPTFNRGILVKELMDNITGEISKHHLENKVEIQVTNNASADDTESIIKNYASKYNYVFYTNNGTNIGLGPNVLKSMFLANGKYCLLLGDDDRIKPDSLPPLISFLEKTPDAGLLLDTSTNKKDKEEKPVMLNLIQLLERYYYFMGNAGVFVVLSSYIKENYENRNFKGNSFSWPQTQLMIMSSYKHSEKKILSGNFNLLGESEHGNITLYNSYYLWKVAYYELVEDIENIRQWVSNDIVRAAKKYFSNHALQNFYNILQCGVFVDDAATKDKTRKHILKNLVHFSIKEKILLRIIVIVFWLPAFLSGTLSDIFILITRGVKGLKKKNNFVNHEKQKKEIIKSKKESIIREFSFENLPGEKINT